jgi:putative ATP-dependent endonuclease of the OLD family
MTLFERFKDTKLYIQNYKSFGNDEQGFDSIQPINVLVGRNNSGKSALLDLIQFACGNHRFGAGTENRGSPAKVFLQTLIEEGNVASTFPRHVSGGAIPGNHYEFGKRYIGRPAKINISAPGSPTLFSIDFGDLPSEPLGIFQSLATGATNPFAGMSFKRLAADRDISPEVDSQTNSIAQTGSGFTNVIQRFINKSTLPNYLVEQKLLTELNRIFAPDAVFRNIRIRQHDDGAWEVYLEEQDKGTIALSHSGSGLKTVLLVLGFLVLIPHIEGKSMSSYVFAFEELENNLHPSLQRRLVKYICDVATEKEFLVFLTTHSSAVIDMLGHNRNAQIIHVTHAGDTARARRVTTYVENRGILDDLDVRASDLLQANSIVWVEGPSDRLYFNRWIDLATQGAIEEGTHYQCVFYGGRLLAHLTGEDPFDSTEHEAIKIFRVNRNAIVLMDSDKSNLESEANRTKKRIVEEVEALGGMAWITAGREVENYLPNEALKRRFPAMTELLGAFDDLADILNRFADGEGKRFERNKVMFAESMLPLIQRADLAECLDLEPQVLQASKAIASWNRIDVTWGPIISHDRPV